MVKSAVLLIITFFVFVSFCFSQTKETNKQESDFSSEPFPIVYGKKGDNFPQNVKIKGTIVDASPAGFYCGVFAVAGTLKIKLDEKVEGYNDDYLYAVVLCFAVEKKETLLNKSVEMEAVKLERYPYEFGVLATNNIDSKGVPFYRLKGIDGIGGLLKKIENKPRKN